MKQNVVVSLFSVPSEAYQAFAEASVYTQTEKTQIAQIALVKRENGLIIPVQISDLTANVANGALTGGLIGALIGIWGGPLGMILGMTTGSLIGGADGSIETLGESDLLSNVAQKLSDGDTAIVLLAQETDESELDQFFARFKTTVARWDAAVVQKDVAAAVLVQQEQARQVREALHKRRKEEIKDKVEELKASVSAKIDAFKEDSKAKFERLAAKIKK
ncbi:DUF1269 domain-containing protein [Pelistega sp. NLN82]|uniref:DUF1269 domain-containing protein n=1 Tax=Pelistega ratti TaxID=2652177 RepID=A0A6L9Y5F2_9BURK|nr:DUF1269 domain-containing protein [Pelistega ratti]NEN75048.1 DUF1269 domain-containing protein [Pelistega ratti]